jgi:hypothetical protein
MNFIPHLCLKLAVKVNILGPLLAKRGWGSIVAKLRQIPLGPLGAPAGRAQPVVDRPVRADPLWTHRVLTLWENMLVQ